VIDFEDALEHELVRAARTTAQRRSRGRYEAVRRGISVAPVLVSLTVALLIGASAVLTLRASHQDTSKPAQRADPSALRRVVAEYAIFRRPQNAADRTIARKWLPTHTVWGLVRRVATRGGQALYVLLTLDHARLGGQLINTGLAPNGLGASFLTFTPAPLRNSTPAGSFGRTQLVFVPDQITRVVWKNYLNAVLTTHPHHNIAYGPTLRLPWGFTTYAGSRQVDQEDVPLAHIKLSPLSGTSSATGQAEISETNSRLTIQLYADHIKTNHRRYGIWLYSSPRHELYLGHQIGPVIWPHTSLVGVTPTLPHNYRSYRHLLITVQPSRKPTSPGRVLLAGNIPR
jgi:hypothetical protein